MRLLSSASSNTKLRKSQNGQAVYRLVSLALSPDKSAPGHPTNCPSASKSCILACVGSKNVGLASIWDHISLARQAKTAFMRLDRQGFLKQLIQELNVEQDKSDAEGSILAVRMNTFSDLPWFMPSFGSIPDRFPRARLYDYTKVKSYPLDAPDNYNFTFSRSEDNESDCGDLIERGVNVAVVFGTPGPGYTGQRAYNQRIPATYEIAGKRRMTYDGDLNDMRFLDWHSGDGNRARIGRVCGLRLKASNNMAREQSLANGFAVTVE